MSLKGEGDFSGIGGKRQDCSHQTSVPTLPSGPDRGVCLLEDDPDLLPLGYNMIGGAGCSSVSLHTLLLSCLSGPAILQVILEHRVDFFKGHFLTLPLPSLFLNKTFTKSLIILC